MSAAFSGVPGAAMLTMEATRLDARVDATVEARDWSFARDEAPRIDARWAALTAEKPLLFDGRVLMARRPRIEAGAFGCRCFATGYKPFLCWREFGHPQAPDDPVFNLFAMPALRSVDGAFMLGRMSAGTANAGRLYFPAGTPEPTDADADGVVDFDGNILRELEEETGLAAHEVVLDACWTIVSAGPLIACMKVVRSSLAAAELQARVAAFVASETEPELDGLHAVTGLDDLDPVRMPPFMLHYLGGRLRG